METYIIEYRWIDKQKNLLEFLKMYNCKTYIYEPINQHWIVVDMVNVEHIIPNQHLVEIRRVNSNCNIDGI